jgi:hypothetical protein
MLVAWYLSCQCYINHFISGIIQDKSWSSTNFFFPTIILSTLWWQSILHTNTILFLFSLYFGRCHFASIWAKHRVFASFIIFQQIIQFLFLSFRISKNKSFSPVGTLSFLIFFLFLSISAHDDNCLFFLLSDIIFSFFSVIFCSFLVSLCCLCVSMLSIFSFVEDKVTYNRDIIIDNIIIISHTLAIRRLSVVIQNITIRNPISRNINIIIY